MYWYRYFKKTVAAGVATIKAKASLDVFDLTSVSSVKVTTLTGNVTGDVTGDLTGKVTGNVTGAVTGDVTGKLTGNVTGNVTGDLTGHVLYTSVDDAADGAIDPAYEYHILSKDSAGDYTLVAPAADNTGYMISVKSASAEAHVITCTGTFAGIGVTEGNNTATLGGAINDGFIAISDGTNWVIVNNVNATMSTAT